MPLQPKPYLMLKKIIPTLLLSAICLYGCQNNPEEQAVTEQPTEAEPLSFRTESLKRESTMCGENERGCATASISYLVAENGTQALRDSLNAYMQQRLLQLQLDQNPDRTLTQTENAAATLAEAFISEQEEFVASMDEVPATAAWYLEVNASPIYQTQIVVTLQLQSSNYTGGAHGNSYTSLQTFNASGHRLSLADMVSDTVPLQQLAEEQLRQEYDFVGDKSFAEAGMFVDGDALPLPQEAGLTKDGLLLLYNPYEIGPYAMGVISLTIPYARLGQSLKPTYRP